MEAIRSAIVIIMVIINLISVSAINLTIYFHSKLIGIKKVVELSTINFTIYESTVIIVEVTSITKLEQELILFIIIIVIEYLSIRGLIIIIFII